MAERPYPVALVISAEAVDYGYGGHDVFLNGELIGHRPYDGSVDSEVCDETTKALAAMLRERLGWKQGADEE